MELSSRALAAALGPVWGSVTVVAETGSTNADLLAEAARPGGAGRAVLVAEHQTAGRGRLDRRWTAPTGRALTFSVLLRPAVAVGTWGWLPLLAGVALHEAVTAVGVDVGLKWPNDLMALPGEHKVAGILAQVRGDAAVVGVGLNVSQTAAELPVPSARSLALCGAGGLDRAELVIAILGRLDRWLGDWQAAGGDAEVCGLAAAYRASCLTLGRPVRVAVTSGASISGSVVGVDAVGRLLVDAGAGEPVALAAGDVEHVR